MGHKAALLQGRIVAAHGRHYTVELDDGSLRKCFPRGKKGGAAVGDNVLIQPQGRDEGVIENILERRNLLYRSDDMRTKQFAANVDQLLIVVAVEPAFSHDLVGRALVAAQSAGIQPIILLNKADLSAGLPAARQRVQNLTGASECGPLAPVLEISALDSAAAADALLPLLRDRCSLLLGQSGMGKSSILNALVPDALAHTQAHSVALDAGKHTTTSTRLYHLPDGRGSLIDSPGFQTFGLYHLTPGELERGFPEFAEPARHCRFYNCMHRQEPGCGVLQAVAQGRIPAERHALYLRILAENEAQSRY